ncbi:unnamed protein product [Didymodactylos carnosus]|uniref:Uncharacterized protein n=1 Tax=Didymodactylos carnosus TaxID=1234261 RepID=A0A816B5T7_9BILA|nr:unnamed protein product [Didymodactylos carnosus]CAF1604643.1 unnamed protein product [Didymodactylos carnosus]CAF4269176.1 unnamed protein product [Didymodactylos carnosus]CAF4483657.1 unnamed protein product [Didymodactylos carnosus]
MIKAFKNNIRKDNHDKKWDEVGGLDGFINSVEKLGQDYRHLETDNNWREVSSIWGRLLTGTRFKKNDEKSRKWLYTVWRNNRRDIRAKFLGKKTIDISSVNTDDKNNSTLSTIPSIERKATCSATDETLSNIPKSTLCFLLSYGEWTTIFDHKQYKLKDKWTNIFNQKLIEAGLTCTVKFQYHHVKQKQSRKRNSAFFSCMAHCKIKLCCIVLCIKLKDEPQKNMLALFSVEILGEEHHNAEEEVAGRQLTGDVRLEMGE